MEDKKQFILLMLFAFAGPIIIPRLSITSIGKIVLGVVWIVGLFMNFAVFVYTEGMREK